jgi:Concanavalin A-like lectin/glucanases superfamily
MTAAAATAHDSGRPVTIDALTTETEQFVAEPNGGLELTANPSPVRTEQRGRWVPIDTTLHRAADGSLAPVATAYGSVRFSRGGTGPLVSTTAGGITYSLDWPTSLPTPTVSGSVATYRSVLPGVDLQMSATSTGGFSDVLVVHTATAAANPAVTRLTFGAHVTGGRVNSGSDGTMMVTGARAGDTLQSATPLMWDSNTTFTTARTSVPGQARSKTTTAIPIGPDASDASHPGLAAGVAAVRTTLEGSSLTLTPDHGMLTRPSTVYPVYVDPTFVWHDNTGGNFGFEEVKQGAPCNHVSLYDNASPDAGNSGWLGVGYQDYDQGCEGNEHTYYQWSLSSGLHGAIIHSASLDATKTWSASCISTLVDLTWSRAIGSNTDWNNAPGPMSPRYSTSHTFGAAYNADHCPDNPPVAGQFDVTTPIVNSVRSNATQFTVELTENAAESQFNDLAFSRFSTGSLGTSLPVLHIMYDLAPRTPSALSARVGGDNVGCATTTPYPYMGATTPGNPPVLHATVSDPDGDKLQATYKYWIDGSTTATGLSADTLASGSDAQFPLPTTFTSGLTNGKVVDWQVQASDGETTSAWSPVCHYIAEPTAPTQPSINSADGLYPNADTGGTTGAPAGQPGKFTISAPSASTTQFVYGVDEPPTTTNPSNSQIVSSFTGGSVNGTLTDRWSLSDSSGSTATDPTGSHPATLSTAGADFASDASRGQVLALDGSHGYAATAKSVLNTAGSYSVSAWVKLSNTSTYQTAVSQGDGAAASFYLQFSASANAWAFVSPSDNTTAPAAFPSAHAASPPTLNAWTNLVGVFDAGTGKMSLYVNGALAGTAINTSPWNGKGPLAIGAVKLTDGSSNNYFTGSVSDVQTYSRALTASEVTVVEGGAPATGNLTGQWSLSDGTGSVAADPTGNHPATLSSTGTAWSNDPHRGNVLTLDGTNGYAATATSVLNTAGSYSVSAWVKLTNTATYYTALSQGGANVAGFYLQYSAGTNSWAFVAPGTDTGGATQASAHASSAPALNTWTHLVGVFDSPTRLMSLYVNGTLAGTATNTSPNPWNATGPLTIGAVKLAGGASNNYFGGSISDVQTYSRALTASEVTQMYTTATITITPPAPGPHTLSVYAKDAAGDVSAFASYDFVAATDPATNCLTLAACFDNTAISSDTNTSLGAYAATTAPVLNTAGSYSVSAWAKINNIGDYATVLSQGGVKAGGFYLQYSVSANAWAFVAPSSDATGVTQFSAHATTTPALDAWTHLVGVLNASTHTMNLYVNGALAGTAADTSSWNAAGPLAIGGTKLTNGVTNNYFPGSISDVQTYARALTQADVTTIYTGGVAATPTDRWTLSDGSGTSALDPTGAHPTTLSGGAFWSHDATRGEVLALGGATGADGANSFSSEDLTNAGWKSEKKVTVDGATFTLPAFGSGQNDNVLAANQTIGWPGGAALPANSASQLVILATSTHPASAVPAPLAGSPSSGTASDAASQAPYVPVGTPVSGAYCSDSTDAEFPCAADGHITYSGSSLPTPFQLAVPDWLAGPPSLAAVSLPHENEPSGQEPVDPGAKIYAFSVQLLPGATVSSITLPDVSAQEKSGVEALHIFAMAIRDTTTASTDANSTDSWTGAWGSPTEGLYDLGGASFSNQTFRVALKPSLSGGKVRLKFDNALGNVPLDIGAATVALDSGGGAPSPVPIGSFTPLTFNAQPSITIPDGGMIYSDPLSFAVKANQYVLISFQLANGPTAVDPAVADLPEHTLSNTAWEYISAINSGNLTTDATGKPFTGINSAFTNVVTDLDVVTQGIGTTAVLGDGLVDARQPNATPLVQNDIAADLTADESTSPNPYGTVSEGIESNQIMNDDPEIYNDLAVGGPAALSRIDRDILDQPGLTTVVLDEGLEDLLTKHTAGDLDAADTLDTVGYTALLGYLQTYGINVIGIPLTPCNGYAGGSPAMNDVCTPSVDTARTTVNGWLSDTPLGMPSVPIPGIASYYYADTDAAVGTPYPNPEDAEVSLDPNAAMPDHANLTATGYGALTSAYLGPQDTWLLNDPATNPSDVNVANDTAVDNLNPALATNLTAAQNNAALSGSATFAGDASDTAHPEVLQMNGTPGAATTDGPVLTTSGSFTVSAWVKLDSLPTSDADVISQDGVTNSGFVLQYKAADQRWEFGMSASDTVGAPEIKAKAQFAPTTGTWTHLVGSYNATTGALTLFVNGAANGSATDTTPYATAGPLAIGRGQSSGKQIGYFHGELGDVQAWNYTITANQIGALYQQIH